MYLYKEKIKIGHWTSRILASPPPQRPTAFHFCPTPPPTPLQSERHMCIVPYTIIPCFRVFVCNDSPGIKTAFLNVIYYVIYDMLYICYI